MRRLLLLSFTLLLSGSLALSLSPASASALTDAPQTYSAEIDEFFSAGAQSFLAWQYSGDPNNPIENDAFSFFKDGPTCQVLKQKANQYPGRIGVNVHALSNKDPGTIQEILTYLKDNCGVSIVRFWGFDSAANVIKVMQIARLLNLRAIVALVDFGTTNSIAWYTSGYTTTYRAHALSVAQAIITNGLLNNLYVLELANEPHCSGQLGCLNPYNDWVNFMANDLASAGLPRSKIGIGQKASEDTTRGDSPGIGPPDFRASNSAANIGITSGHYYTAAEKLKILQALTVSQNLSKPFYVGEAGSSISTPLPPPLTSQTPQSAGFVDPLEYYPCTETADPEFHPLRPYPFSPCDPLIPQKIPEAKDNPPSFNYLAFACGKSLNVSGAFEFPGQVDLASRDPFPADPNLQDPDYAGDGIYRCGTTAEGSPSECTCDYNGTNPEVLFACTVRRTAFNVAIDLSPAQLPIIGNTQDPMDDATKVNHYLDWYLNGTVQQSEQQPLDPTNPSDMNRLINFSGPVKKLLPQSTQNIIRQTIKLDPPVFDQIHNYFVDPPIRLRDAFQAIFKDVPLASLEDTTGEVTFSLIPDQQPGNVSPIGDLSLVNFLVPDPNPSNAWGKVYNILDPNNRNTLTLKVTGKDETADSRLYFPHLRTDTALSDILRAVGQPKDIAPGSIPNTINPQNRNLVSQENTLHQGINDSTPVQRYDYLTGQDTRNTEIQDTDKLTTPFYDDRTAPPPLFTRHDQLCDLKITRTNPGDSLGGRQIQGLLTYTQFFRYTPQPAPLGCGGDRADCTSTADCCPNLTCDNICLHGSSPACPDGDQSPPVNRCIGGAPPDITLPTEARIATFTKVPAIERLYQTLVTASNSLLRRIIPRHPDAVSDDNYLLKEGFPGATAVGYSSSSTTAPDHTNTPSTVNSVSAGDKSGGPQVYFLHLGSLFDYFLGGSTENLNLQKLLRPKGFYSGGIINPPAPANCPSTTSLPPLPAADSTCNDASSGSSDVACQKSPFTSSLLQDIFESAAFAYHVPVSILVGIFYGEGGLNHPWTNDRVLLASAPGCQDDLFADCDPNSPAAAGPWQIVPSAWNEIGNAAIEKGVTDRNTTNRCNIVDATFAAAKALSIGRSGRADRYPETNGTCGGVTLNYGVGASTSCNWTASDVITASRQYLGYCEAEQTTLASGQPCSYCVTRSTGCSLQSSPPIQNQNCYQRQTLRIATCQSTITP